mgnify:CR=1 FL=1
MKQVINHLRNLDWIIIGSAILLVGIGLLSLYSSSIGREDFTNFYKQAVFLLIGIAIMLVVSFLNYRLFKNDPYFLLFLWGLGVLALIGLLFFGPEIRGVKAWYKIGGISIDPVEYMKIVLLLLMAKYFSLRHVEMYRIKHIVLSAIYFGVPFALVFLQPNLGSGGLLLILWLIISTLTTFPHFLSYYNELAGGSRNCWRIAVDSNYDWGQDLKRLVQYMDANHINKISLDYFGGADPRYYLGDRFEAWQSSKGPARA